MNAEELLQLFVALIGFGTLALFIWALTHKADRAAVLAEFRSTPAVVICWGLALLSLALWFLWAGTDGWVPTGKVWIPLVGFFLAGVFFHDTSIRRSRAKNSRNLRRTDIS